jgi:hypothetical protein
MNWIINPIGISIQDEANMTQIKTPIKISILVIVVIILLFSWKLSAMSNDALNSQSNEQYRRWGVLVNSAHMTEKKNYEQIVKIRDDYMHSPYHKDLTTAFYLNDGTWLRTILADSSVTWGENNDTPLGGNAFAQPLPERLKLTYYEMMADKYYQLDIALPTDKIRTLFETPDEGWQDSYFEGEVWPPQAFDSRDINIAVAPEGWVILFVVGSHGNRYEIGSWQAQEIDANYDADAFFDDDSIPIEELQNEKYKAEVRQKFLTEFKQNNPELFRRWQSGEWQITSDWYKRLQTKYPWNLSVIVDGGGWDGEYDATYANTERYEILSDHIELDKQSLKSVPIQIDTWLTNQAGKRYYASIGLLPIPKFKTNGAYAPYYQDPNVDRLFNHFEQLYPKHSLATNDQHTSPDEFATLKLYFSKDLILQDVYLQKGNQKLPIDGAYHYYLAPVPEGGKYSYKDVNAYFLTEPKVEDLSDPLFVDMD